MTTNLMMRIAMVLPVATLSALGGCAVAPDTAAGVDQMGAAVDPAGTGADPAGTGADPAGTGADQTGTPGRSGADGDGAGDGQGETAAPPADGDERGLPATCAAVAGEADAPLEDGEYLLFVGGDPSKPWVAYCAGLAGGSAKEYLSLHRTAGANFAQYTAGGFSPGSDVRTSYRKIRIDPATLVVDVNDQTFATSTGASSINDAQITSMAFGTAGSCDAAPSGIASVDLRGTELAVAPGSFALNGYLPGGGAALSADGQVVDLTGGGYCGNIAPSGTGLQLVYR